MLLSQDPQAAMRGADYLQRLAQNRDRQLAQATSARNALVQAQAASNQELASVQALQASLQAEQQTINALIGKQQAVLDATTQTQAAAQVAATTQVSRGPDENCTAHGLRGCQPSPRLRRPSQGQPRAGRCADCRRPCCDE